MKKPKSKFRQRLPLIGIFLLLIIGLCFFMYPIIGNWYTEYSALVTIRAYDEAVQQLGNDALKKYVQEAQEYNKALAGSEHKKISTFDYNSILAVTDAIAYIDIPVIGAYYPIYHGLQEDVLQKGIGHMEGTSLPIGGESTHCVLAGHTGLPSTKLFTDLDTLKLGNLFYIHVLDQVLTYSIDQIKIVLPNESDDIRIEQGMDYVTLVTCTPYGVNDHRLLVRGRRVADDTKPMQEEESSSSEVQTSRSRSVNLSPEHSQSSEQTIRVYEREEQKLPARTILWYIAAGVVAFVVIGITIILIVPSSRKKNPKGKNIVAENDRNDKE